MIEFSNKHEDSYPPCAALAATVSICTFLVKCGNIDLLFSFLVKGHFCVGPHIVSKLIHPDNKL